jgi:DNA repair photolyase
MLSMSIRVHEATLSAGIERSREFAKKGLAQFAVNVGTKCGHDCLYCSTGAMLRMHSSFRDADEDPFGTGYAIVDPSTPRRVADDAKAKRNRGLIQLCTTVDAWSPEAQRSGLGRQCLEAILSEPEWTVRILTKNAAVANDFDLVAKHRDRVLIGISLTATPAKTGIMSIVEPNASSIRERMAALKKAQRLGLRVYGMLCPLLPGIANGRAEIEELVTFCLEFGAEEIFAEPVNRRGPGLSRTEAALRERGLVDEADALQSVRSNKGWSSYTVRLLNDLQETLRARGALNKLRFLLYPSRLTAGDRQWVDSHLEGVKLLLKSEGSVS